MGRPKNRSCVGSRVRGIVPAVLLGWSVLAVSLADGGENGGSAVPNDVVGAAKQWFLDWATGLEIERFEARFVAEIGPGKKPRQVIEGTWSVRLRPIFGERLEFRRQVARNFSSDELLPEIEERLSWEADRGEGRVYQLPAGAVQGYGTRTVTRPKSFGRVELPSDLFFLFRKDRELGRYLTSANIEIQLLASDGEFAAIVYGDEDGVVTTYHMDRSREQPIVELCVYMLRPQIPLETERDLDSGPVTLPEKFRRHLLAVRKTVLESQTIDGTAVPVAWRIEHSFRAASEDTTVRLIPGTVRVGAPEPSGGYTLEWPEGTRVYDYGQGASFWVGKDAEPVDGEVIRESDLDFIVEEAGLDRKGAGSQTREAAIETGCAANALYIALALLDRPVGLEPLVRELGIARNNPDSSLSDIVRATHLAQIEARAVEGNRDLLTRAKDAPIILHALREEREMSGGHHEAGHFLTIDDYDSATDTVRVFDPPQLAYRSTLDQVEEAWTGRAVVFGEETIAAIARNDGRTFALRIALGAAALFALGAAIVLSLRMRRKEVRCRELLHA